MSTGAEYFYSEEVTYTCNGGHTLNAKKDGGKTFKETCQADGTYTETESAGCLPVNCGSIDTPGFATQQEDDDGKKLTSLVFGQVSVATCMLAASRWTLSSQNRGRQSRCATKQHAVQATRGESPRNTSTRINT